MPGDGPKLVPPDHWLTVKRAKAVCATCPVIDECLNFAIVHNERLGIWGGTHEKERRPLRRRWVLAHPEETFNAAAKVREDVA